MAEHRSPETNSSRRDFLKTTTAAAGAALVTNLALTPNVHAAGDDVIKVGLIGCGGRGSGAAENVLHSAKNVKLVAVGDAFKDRAEGFKNQITRAAQNDGKIKELGNSVDIGDRVFVGLDAYEKVLNAGIDYVILATPPGFRPLHIQAAVAAGKNIFTEKPVGVDGTGIRKVMAAYDDAKKKNLGIAAGTQRRHQAPYIETIKQLHDGAIGDIVAGRCYWNQGILWKRDRQPTWSDLEYQMRNWYNFLWLCGDHIVEQHVHNIDVINWVIGSHPLKSVSMGYRTRTDPGYGHIYDFFANDYTYPKEVHVLSMCRQISECANSVSEAVQGTKGWCQVNAYQINGKRAVGGGRRGEVNPYVQEHTDLINSIREGKPINELKQVAESTLTAIMGRMSAYTGKEVTWEQALNSKEDTMLPNLSWDMTLQTPPVPVPGKTPLV